MATRSGMALWLGNFLYVKNRRCMSVSNFLNTCFKDLTHACIVPGLHFIDINSVCTFFFLKSFQDFRNGTLCCLIFLWNRNAISIIPYKDCQWYLEYPCRIHGFPKMAF